MYGHFCSVPQVSLKDRYHCTKPYVIIESRAEITPASFRYKVQVEGGMSEAKLICKNEKELDYWPGEHRVRGEAKHILQVAPTANTCVTQVTQLGNKK